MRNEELQLVLRRFGYSQFRRAPRTRVYPILKSLLRVSIRRELLSQQGHFRTAVPVMSIRPSVAFSSSHSWFGSFFTQQFCAGLGVLGIFVFSQPSVSLREQLKYLRVVRLRLG